MHNLWQFHIQCKVNLKKISSLRRIVHTAQLFSQLHCLLSYTNLFPSDSSCYRHSIVINFIWKWNGCSQILSAALPRHQPLMASKSGMTISIVILCVPILSNFTTTSESLENILFTVIALKHHVQKETGGNNDDRFYLVSALSLFFCKGSTPAKNHLRLNPLSRHIYTGQKVIDWQTVHQGRKWGHLYHRPNFAGRREGNIRQSKQPTGYWLSLWEW